MQIDTCRNSKPSIRQSASTCFVTVMGMGMCLYICRNTVIAHIKSTFLLEGRTNRRRTRTSALYLNKNMPRLVAGRTTYHGQTYVFLLPLPVFKSESTGKPHPKLRATSSPRRQIPGSGKTQRKASLKLPTRRLSFSCRFIWRQTVSRS